MFRLISAGNNRAKETIKICLRFCPVTRIASGSKKAAVQIKYIYAEIEIQQE